MAKKYAKTDYKAAERDARADLIAKVLDTIENENLVWRNGWNIQLCQPYNPVTGTRYKGRNRLYLMAYAEKNGLNDCRYTTANGARTLAPYDESGQPTAHVKKDTHGAPVFKWAVVDWNKKNKDQEDYEPDYHLSLVGGFKVHNFANIENAPAQVWPAKTDSELFAIADEFIVFLEGQGIKVQECGQDSAHFRATNKTITLPPRGAFDSAADFCATLFHEAAHSSMKTTDKRPFPRTANERATEELRAEFAALFIQSDLQLPQFGTTANYEENSAAYLQSWIKGVDERERDKAILKAISDAQNIAEHFRAAFVACGILEADKETDEKAA